MKKSSNLNNLEMHIDWFCEKQTEFHDNLIYGIK